jgi:hypothetical protein
MGSLLAHHYALASLAFWVALQGGALLYSAVRGQVMPAMLAAVDKAGPLEDGVSREETARGFVYISVVWFLAVTALAAYAFHAAYAGSVLWLLVFLVVGGWSLYDTASSPFVLGRMYPGSLNWHSWLQAVVGTLVWVFLFVVLCASLLRHAT